MSAPRVLLACVAEDAPVFHARVESLVGSARRLGGCLSESPIVVSMVGGANPAFVRRLQALDVEVRVVRRMTDSGAPHANKLRMLELHEREDFDVLLAADCDVAVAEDPTMYLPRDSIGVVPADVDPLTEGQWRRLFDGVALDLRERSVRATTTGRPMYPYFNSGVVAVPRHLCVDLLATWTRALEDLHALWQRNPNVIPRAKRFFADQIALMIALQRGLPWTEASRELNFATHVDLHEPTVQSLKPALLHYHGAVDDEGFLLMPRSPVAARAADRVNRDRAAAHGYRYEGLKMPPTPGSARRAIDRVGEAAKAAGRPLLRR
ncbi:MAG TPA: hypothetical protein VIJ33_06280 [Solirubrobacteraceae bacterium]